ncbi:NADPh quinone reductase [Podila clonocystis]|nr:NADPh quinone reductase [Podila clonocystis]
MTAYSPNLPQAMEALRWSKVGDPAEILTMDENIPLPVPTGTSILVKMHAASINPVDWKSMKGAFPRFVMPKVKTPGLDISGVVVGLGPNVGKSNKPGIQRFAIGDRVMAMQDIRVSGTMQEYVPVDESLLLKAPAEWNDVTAAAFPTCGVAVYQSLVLSGQLKSGDKVLVNGGSGGVGSIAVQIATALGASVVAVCSTANVDLVKSLGAKDVVDYNTTKVYEEYTNKDFDIVFDAVGSPELYTHSSTLLKPTGRYVQIALPDNALNSLVGGMLFGFQVVGRLLNSFITRGPSFAVVAATPNREHLAAATHIMIRANVKPIIGAKYAFELDSVLEALALSQSGRAKGKILIVAPGHL